MASSQEVFLVNRATGGGSSRSLTISGLCFGPLLKTINDVRCKTWDFVHRVDTCGEILVTAFSFQSKNKVHSAPYHSHHPRLTQSALMALDIRHENYTFIDFGCGKGRVLLLASAFPFRKILGLEFAMPLVDVARQNLRSYRSKTPRSCNIEVILTDVTDFDLPPEPEVLYFYSPFDGAIMDQVIQNIESSLHLAPRDVLILYTGSIASRDQVFSHRHYKRLRRESYFDIYRIARIENG